MADPRVERRANLVVQLGAVNVANKVGLRVIVGISCPQSRLPGLIGPKNQGQVTSDPQVRGVDLFGNSRLVRGQCDVGAIEVSFPETLASSLGITRGSRSCVQLGLADAIAAVPVVFIPWRGVEEAASAAPGTLASAPACDWVEVFRAYYSMKALCALLAVGGMAAIWL